MNYIAQVDENVCSAHGDCAVIAPEVFRLEDVAVVVGTGADDRMEEAAEACPAVAISLFDVATGEQVYP